MAKRVRAKSSRKVGAKFDCVDGPWSGERLYLSLDGTTAWFTLKGVTGRYNNGVFQRRKEQ